MSPSLMLDTRTCASVCDSRNVASRFSMIGVYTASSPWANSRSQAPCLAALRATVTARSAASSVPRASTRKAWPPAVSRTPRGRRSNKVTPSSVSRSWICFDRAGWATRRRPAAGHLCAFYLSDVGRTRQAARLLGDGLDAGSICILIADRGVRERVLARLGRRRRSLRRDLEAKRLLVSEYAHLAATQLEF